jgi:hypothetical protein
MNCSRCSTDLVTMAELLVGSCDACLVLEQAERGKKIVQGDTKKNEAIGRVFDAAPQEWIDKALQAVFWAASNHDRFTTDEVWAFEVEGEALDSPPEPRAMGAVMRIAESSGWVEPTRDFRLSTRPVCHRRPSRVWQRSDFVPMRQRVVLRPRASSTDARDALRASAGGNMPCLRSERFLRLRRRRRSGLLSSSRSAGLHTRGAFLC